MKFTLLLCETIFSSVKSEVIHGVADILLEFYDEPTDRSKENIHFTESCRRCFQTVFSAHQKQVLPLYWRNATVVRFGFCKYCFCFFLDTWPKLKMLGKFEFHWFFKIAPLIDSADRVLSCLCLKWGTDGVMRAYSPPLHLCAEMCLTACRQSYLVTKPKHWPPPGTISLHTSQCAAPARQTQPEEWMRRYRHTNSEYFLEPFQIYQLRDTWWT